MKRALTLILLAAFAVAPAAFADDKPGTPVRRTVLVRDGKVLELDGELLAGKRMFLGISPLDLTPQLRDHFGAEKDSGILIAEVEPNSPAAKAGLKVGDIIVALDGKDVASSGDLRRSLNAKKDGDTVRIDVLRGRSRQTLVATLVERDFPGLFREGEMFRQGDMKELQKQLNTTFNSPEWKARVDRLRPLGGDCGDLQSRIRDLETRLKDLEKRLQK
jgi:membrane-associated protease RseP (regulator of RpoE activity)